VTGPWHWLVHVMGVDQGLPYGRWNWYNFHSGFAGSVFLGSLLNGIAVFFLFYIHRTCQHSAWCLRWGKYPVAGGLARTCHKHNPDLSRLGGRKPRGADLLRLHREWKEQAR